MLKILVHGFGLVERKAPDNSLIVIVKEEFEFRQEHGEPQR